VNLTDASFFYNRRFEKNLIFKMTTRKYSSEVVMVLLRLSMICYGRHIILPPVTSTKRSLTRSAKQRTLGMMVGAVIKLAQSDILHILL
jgi:hypothetical protein